MKSTDIIILQAFLDALAKLNQSLPAQIQNQLNEFVKSLTADSTNIGELDIIAQTYEPLYRIYKKELTSLVATGAKKSKGIAHPPLEELSGQNTPDILNTARNIFNSNDSVREAKKYNPPENIFRRIFNLLIMNNHQ